MIYHQVRSLLDDLQQKIISADLKSAIGLAKLYGSLAWRNHVHCYSAPEIEDCLFQKLQELRVLPKNIKLKKNGKILHILSEGFTSGGHTRVVENLLSENGATPCQDVIIVGLCPREILINMRNSGATVSFVKSKGISAVVELSSLMSNYNSVLLHIHPDDIVATLAARVARDTGTKVGLYNHADHCFTYGFSAVDIVFEVSIFGRAISEKYRPKYRWSFAGIPLKSPPYMIEKTTGDYILSSGPSYKYDFREGGVFACLLEELILALNKKCIVIGPGSLPPDASKKLKELAKEGMLVILPSVKHEVYVQYLKNCFFYLDSAPVTGGSALPEAAMLGKPCLGLTNPIMGYSPVDTIRSRTTRELVQRALALTAKSTYLQDKLLYEVHMGRNVLNRIRMGLDSGECFDIPYDIDKEQLNLDFMSLKWAECGHLLVSASAFDFLSFKGRLAFLALLAKHGLLCQIINPKKFKVFFYTFTYRKFRSYGIRSNPSDAVLFINKQRVAFISYLRRIILNNRY